MNKLIVGLLLINNAPICCPFRGNFNFPSRADPIERVIAANVPLPIGDKSLLQRCQIYSPEEGRTVVGLVGRGILVYVEWYRLHERVLSP